MVPASNSWWKLQQLQESPMARIFSIPPARDKYLRECLHRERDKKYRFSFHALNYMKSLLFLINYNHFAIESLLNQLINLVYALIFVFQNLRLIKTSCFRHHEKWPTDYYTFACLVCCHILERNCNVSISDFPKFGRISWKTYVTF